MSPRGMVLPDGRRGAAPATSTPSWCCVQNIDGPYRAAPDVTMMTSWHSAGEPAAEERPRLAAADPTGGGTWPTSPAARCACPACRCWPPADRGYCPLGRETGIARIEWRDGWPYVEGGKHAQLIERPAGGGTAQPFRAAGGTISTPVRSTPELQTCAIPVRRWTILGSLTALLASCRLLRRQRLAPARPLPSRPWRAGQPSPSVQKRGCSFRRSTSSRARG